ncbi:hypothetical protein Tco_0858391 [Tanacetum coccineum]|uniref:Uncharacterized protein n=1 Tax=Tanacetum coccineum TaxID=301880 RepID=A0ABQ5BEP0_9ASTR
MSMMWNPINRRVKNGLRRLKKNLNHKVVRVKYENKPENEAEGSSEQTTDYGSNWGWNRKVERNRDQGRLMRSNDGGIGGPLWQGFWWFQERGYNPYLLSKCAASRTGPIGHMTIEGLAAPYSGIGANPGSLQGSYLRRNITKGNSKGKKKKESEDVLDK